MPTDLEIQMEVERLAVRDFACQQKTPNPTMISIDMTVSAGAVSEEPPHTPVPPTTGTADTAAESRRSRHKKLK